MAHKHLRYPLAISGFLLLALTACGQPAAENTASTAVASLNTPGSTSASTAPPPADSERPRLRMDMTEEEKNRLHEPHTACLREHDPNGTGTGAGPAGSTLYSEEAMKACASKYPLPPWEMDADNPTFADNWHRNVQCLNRGGLKVVETEPGSWTYDGQPTMGHDEQRKLEKHCEQEAFGGGGK